MLSAVGMRSTSRTIGSLERRQDPLSQLRRRVGLAQAALHDRELVAAEARQGVRIPQAGGDPFRHGDQQPIADDVAVAVVDQLEVIDVEEVQADELARPIGAAQRLIEPVGEQQTIGQVGERIMMSEVLDPRA